MPILSDSFISQFNLHYSVPKRVDGLTQATYPFFNSNTNPNIQPKKIVIKTVEAVGVEGDCLISIGTNSPDYNNILKVYAVRAVPGAVEAIDMDYVTRQFQDITDPFTGTEIRLNVSTVPSAGTLNFKLSFDFEPNEAF